MRKSRKPDIVIHAGFLVASYTCKCGMAYDHVTFVVATAKGKERLIFHPCAACGRVNWFLYRRKDILWHTPSAMKEQVDALLGAATYESCTVEQGDRSALRCIYCGGSLVDYGANKVICAACDKIQP
jgi:hypothetical protein